MTGPGWPDARGWIGIGQYGLTLIIVIAIICQPALLRVDAFLILATAIVITGWTGSVLAWAYAATKGGGELADRNATIVEKQVKP
ncbi:hypothetical protein [Sphingomonas sanxanigenens]|uniref:Uncharacterized protein n=1 Tax=Sphingomonas sanxanigenens DSM 19645 = NX02 TaxID=1123269 RepID=W0AK22_9SPHN|nr:hypothetical protein [Sphingomonas sanxanigenens]AHE55995.1 hypothetical protein NX02_21825 [Sphingomonas sanxanigenens DSM 19645 = NX02]